MKIIYPLLAILLGLSCSETNTQNRNNNLNSKEYEKEYVNCIDSSNKNLRILRLTGTSYEIGLQHGTLLKDEINESIENWKMQLKEQYEYYPEDFIKLILDSTDYISAIKNSTPGLLDELKGISDGSEIELETILVYNFIDEIWTNFHLINSVDHCTAIAVNNHEKSDNIVLLGANIDCPQKDYYILDIQHNDFPRILTPTFPGYLGANGLSKEFGITVNSLWDLNGSFDGLPVVCVVRGALMQPDFKSATDFLKNIKHASGLNYTLADNHQVLSIECSANAKEIYWPNPENRTYTYHTNDPRVNKDFSDRYIQLVEGEMKKNISTWEFHCDRLQSLNERITSNSNLQDIKDALSSKDYKVPICNEDTWISTIVEFRKNETKLYISPGKPDSTEYITIEIE